MDNLKEIKDGETENTHQWTISEKHKMERLNMMMNLASEYLRVLCHKANGDPLGERSRTVTPHVVGQVQLQGALVLPGSGAEHVKLHA
jgi:hypothetical protein